MHYITTIIANKTNKMTKTTLERIAEEENRNNILLRALLVKGFPNKETASQVGLPGIYASDKTNRELVPTLKLKLLSSAESLIRLYGDYFNESAKPRGKDSVSIAQAMANSYESYQMQYVVLTHELVNKLVKGEDKK
jgi:hypothetical protein